MFDVRRPRFRVVLASVAVVLGATVLVPSTANAAGQSHGGWGSLDSVTVGGYDDYQINRTVDVVQGTSGTNLIFWFTAGKALNDGTLTIDVPVRDWPAALRDAQSGLSPTQSGGVGVRPTSTYPGAGDSADYCGLYGLVGTGVEGGPVRAEPFALTVTGTATGQRIEAAHLHCAAGQRIAVRIVGLTAPRSGLYRFPVRVTDSGTGPRWVIDPWLTVRPTPRVRLAIELPPTPIDAEAGMVPASIGVRVVTAGGIPVSHYSGTIRLYTDPEDCAVSNRGYQDYDVTPTRRGGYRLDYPFQQSGTYSLIAEDVDQRAMPARSDPFTVVDGNMHPACPASYH